MKCDDCKWKDINPNATFEDEIISCKYVGVRQIMIDKESFICTAYTEAANGKNRTN